MRNQPDNRRSILKQVLTGKLQGQTAASALRSVLNGGNSPCVAIRYPSGLYSFGEERDLTKAQVLEKASGTLFFLPHNGRD